MDFQKLSQISYECRVKIIQMVTEKKTAFVGSAFSAIDLLTVLYHEFMFIDPKNPWADDRDFFFLSKGHAALALYVTLHSKGLISEAELKKFNNENDKIGVHPAIHALPGVEASTGSLGHGFGLACGVSLANKIKGSKRRTYVMMGDGECNEGSVWEAAMFAAKQKMSSLTIIIDRNRLQSYGHDADVLNMGDMAEKFKAFGLHTLEIDGHDFEQIHHAFTKAIAHQDGATVIVANTIKGKGVSYMEDKTLWHYKWPDESLLEQGLMELAGERKSEK